MSYDANITSCMSLKALTNVIRYVIWLQHDIMYEFEGADQCQKTCHITSAWHRVWLWRRWPMSEFMSHDLVPLHVTTSGAPANLIWCQHKLMMMSCTMSYDIYQCRKSCHMTSQWHHVVAVCDGSRDYTPNPTHTHTHTHLPTHPLRPDDACNLHCTFV